MKAVFDTNVVASASFWRGPPFQCLSAWVQGRCEVAVSPALLAEYHETIQSLRSEFADKPFVPWADTLTESAELVFPVFQVSGLLALIFPRLQAMITW